MSNARAMAGAAVPDGAKFLFHGWESDRAQQMYERVFDYVQHATGLTTGVLDKLVKFKVLRHQTAERGPLYSLQVWGDAARVLHKLPWDLSQYLTEMHVKCYLVEHEPGMYEWLQDAMWAAPYTVNVSFYKSRNSGNAKKGTGERGARIGSRKSDKHSVIYRRQKEKPGFETRVSDKTLKRLVREVDSTRTALSGKTLIDDAGCWTLLHSKVGTVGYTHALKVLREMGVNLCDYVAAVTDERQEGPATHAITLDKNEEASFLPPPQAE